MLHVEVEVHFTIASVSAIGVLPTGLQYLTLQCTQNATFLGNQTLHTTDMATVNCISIDQTFGPWAQSCRGGLDFTFLFEDAILGILPSCLFIILAVLRIFQLRKEKIKVNTRLSWLLAAKQVRLP
jgi:hypothetical protein